MLDLPLRDELPDTEPVLDTLGEIDYQATYKKLQKRFELILKASAALFDLENASRQTMAYYKRRNDAILDYLDTVEERKQATLDKDRLDALVGQCPRIADTVLPIADLDNPDLKIHKKHYENLYMTEQISDLVNDDASPLEVDPTLAQWWCQTHNRADLVLPQFRLADVPSEGIQEGYVGSGLEMNWLELDKPKKVVKKRPEKKKKAEKPAPAEVATS